MINKLKTSTLKLTWTDILVPVLILHLLLTNKDEWLQIPQDVLFYALLFLFVYYISRLFILFAPIRKTSLVFFVIIGIMSLYESGLGLIQLIGKNNSNHFLYSCTGSFYNPGPYGGFLAICISLLTAYHVKYNNQTQKNISKLLYWGASTIAIVACIILPSTQSRSAILALGCGMILLAFGTERIRVNIKPFLKRYGLWLTLGLAVIGTGAYLFKKPSADGRLFMDKICIKAMCDNGWKGAGIGHFGGAYGKAQASYFKEQIEEKGKNDLDWRAINDHDRMTADCPDNAFNEYLFIGVEAGPIAMLLFIGIIVSAIIISFKRGTIWCYGMTAFAVFALFSYPLHVKQFQILLPILLAACASDQQQNLQEQNDESNALLSIGTSNLWGLVILLVLLVTMPSIYLINLPEIRKYKKAECSWKEAERWHHMEYYEYVVEECDTLLPYMKHDYRFLFAYGQSLNKTGRYEKSDSILKLGTIICSDPMFWNVMGNNSLALGKYSEAEERYKHAFYMVPNRLYPLYLIAKMYNYEGDTARFIIMSKVIYDFIPKVESTLTVSLREDINSMN